MDNRNGVPSLALGWCSSLQGKRAHRGGKVSKQEEKKCSTGKPAG